MISKNKIKLIRSLEQRKFRRELKLFVAEGHKLVDDLLPAFECVFLAACKEWTERRADVWQRLAAKGCETLEVSDEELQKASLQKNPQDVLAVFRQRPDNGMPDGICQRQLCLALDGVQDPGNLGTVLRIDDQATSDSYGDPQFYPQRFGYASGTYTINLNLNTMTLTLTLEQ